MPVDNNDLNALGEERERRRREQERKEAEERKQREEMAGGQDEERPLLNRWLGDVDEDPRR